MSNSMLPTLFAALGCFLAARYVILRVLDRAPRARALLPATLSSDAVAACLALLVSVVATAAGTGAPTRTDSAGNVSVDLNTSPAVLQLMAYAERHIPKAAPMTPFPGERSQGGLPDVATMIERLAARLEVDAEDADGWRMLGWSHAATGDFAAAVKAYRRAMALRPSDMDIKTSAAEAMVKSADVDLGVEARRLIESIIAAAPRHARARFQRGIARSETGDLSGAVDDWQAALASSGDDAELSSELKSRIADVSARKSTAEKSDQAATPRD